MKKRYLIAVCIFVVCIMIFVGCSLDLSGDASRFLGIWETSGGEIWNFKKNGQLSISSSPVTLDWKVENNMLHVNSFLNIYYIKATYAFQEEDEEVVLKLVDSSQSAYTFGAGAGEFITLYR